MEGGEGKTEEERVLVNLLEYRSEYRSEFPDVYPTSLPLSDASQAPIWTFQTRNQPVQPSQAQNKLFQTCFQPLLARSHYFQARQLISLSVSDL